jgi:hypothetical protein
MPQKKRPPIRISAAKIARAIAYGGNTNQRSVRSIISRLFEDCIVYQSRWISDSVATHEERVGFANEGRNRWYRTGPKQPWSLRHGPPTLLGLTPIQLIFARTTDEYLQWYINKGLHPDIESIKAMYKVDVVTMPYIIKLEMALFGRTIENVDIREPVQSDTVAQLFKMEGGQAGMKKFIALHQAAFEHRDLLEAEGARSASSHSAAVGR